VASCHNHNSARKTGLGGLTRKAAQRVEAMDGRAKLSFAYNQIGLPPVTQQNFFKKNEMLQVSVTEIVAQL
jgi:hypothetical protein|tara:strand:+ start:87 stop:299 length:213 start_codon:yes stop_codon:yes gene_type:complete